MEEYDYVLYRQIQEFKARYYEQHHKGVNFPDTVKGLLDSGAVLHGRPEKPDFLSWNLQDTSELVELIGRLPVTIKELENPLNEKIPLADNALHLFPQRDTQILLESCYAAPEYVFVDFFTVVYVLEGCCTLYLKNASHKLEIGGLCILPPRTPFYVFSGPSDLVITIQSKESTFLFNFSQLLRHENILTKFFRRTLLEDFKDCKFFVLPPDKRICMLIQNLFAEDITSDLYSDTAFNNFLQIFYLSIIRSTEPTYQYYSVQERPPVKTLMPAILEYITQNYRRLTLQELSAHFHYDSTYMSHLVKQLTGHSFRCIVMELKLNEAKKLLEVTELSVNTIAKKAGFGNAEALSYTLKKETGLTPTMYREQVK